MRSRLTAAILLALAAAGAQAATTTELPRTVRPSHYDVSITPHAQTLDFDARVVVDLEVLEPTPSIVLHARDLTFSKAALEGADGKDFATPKIALDADTQTATFTFPAPLAAGRYKLALDYRGKIATQASGLFAIDYDNAKGKQRALFTQFEVADARAMVPSWDEPSYKATFTLTAVVPAGQMAVSNMPVADRKEAGGLATVTFAPSPKMSTYLLFLGVGDLERKGMQVDGTDLGVIAQTGAVEQAAFALEGSALVLREYNDYFGTPYPLPKLDNIASPGSSQFFSAMENWGAIYTFEHTLLLDPTISTQADKQRVFNVAAHEIAHQWFGNLVTMGWWDDLWLNEGFATWMAGRTTAKLHPEWNTRLGTVGGRDYAMGRDAVATTHPVVQPAATAAEAGQLFDAITYSKGGAVIRMLEGYVGEDSWREGVRNYIRKNAYGNAVSADLWREIEAASDAPIVEIARQFTTQPGVPLIRVDGAACEGGNTTVQLSQGEFTKDRPGKVPLAWDVPVIAATLGGEPARTVVSGGKATLSVPGCGPLIVNAGQSGYYRTQYPAEAFAQLRDGFARLEPIDQLGLLADTWALGMAGLQPASDIVGFVDATPVDADPQVWAENIGNLVYLEEMYRGDAARHEAFRTFALARLAPVFARIGWEAKAGEPDPVVNLRSNLIDALGALGDPAVIAEARRRYAASATDPTAMPVALKKNILGVVALHADAATWDALHALAIAEKTPLVRDEYYSLLSSAKDPALARRALELALTDEPGATNTADMFGYVSAQHPELALDVALANRATIDARLATGANVRFYPGLATGSLDRATIAKLQAYAKAHIAEPLRRDADTAVANIEYRLRIRDERLPAIDAWLRDHGGGSQPAR